MTQPTLIIGNKNYSSWSLRPWLAMTVAGVPFTEKLIRLFDENWPAAIAKVSPTRKVPVLIDGDLVIVETIAILEYVAEQHPGANLWPVDTRARAMARSVSAEMHAGFTALRTHMPMNIRASYPGKGMGEGVSADIARIEDIWRTCRETYGDGGPFLFGQFTIADAMFAPVVCRLTTYAPPLSDASKEYMAAVQALPAMKDWSDAGRAEPWTVAEDEIEE